jgi:hypothetical protein
VDVPPPPPGEAPPDGEEDEEAMMMRMMGFGGFSSTQGKHVEDEFANASAVQKKTKRQARQYMNRKGGFNRPLPAEKTGQRQNMTWLWRQSFHSAMCGLVTQLKLHL